jgi:sugar phosphate isomerase/epimerase
MENIAVSPCSNPEFTPEEALAAYSELGYHRFEAFTGWGTSRRIGHFDIDRDPAEYLRLGERYGMQIASVQLPAVLDDVEETLQHTIRAAVFAERLGAAVVILKARKLENLINAALPFLDAIQGLDVTPVITNHSGSGSAIRTLEEYRTAIDTIADPRMKTLLEVGHFHSVGVSWKEGYDLLGDSIALIHIKDQVGDRPVPFGHGEIDLPGLFQHMRSVGYTGDYVVEMENEDHENRLRYLGDAVAFLQTYCLEAAR